MINSQIACLHILLQQVIAEQTIKTAAILLANIYNLGYVFNIPFMQKHADVSRYQTTCPLEQVSHA